MLEWRRNHRYKEIMKTKIFDITVPIETGMLVYPEDPRVIIENFSLDKNNSPSVSRISFGSHTGTHVDAPRHFFKNGKSLDKIPPEVFIRPCVVYDIGNAEKITASIIKSLKIQNEERVLFKTKNSMLWKKKIKKFVENYVYLAPDAAEYLVSSGVKVVGIDYFSVDSFHDKECPIHKILLSAGVLILENLNLSDVPAGKYELICAPLRIKNSDAAPARVFLVSNR
jgi:arylformamidase